RPTSDPVNRRAAASAVASSESRSGYGRPHSSAVAHAGTSQQASSVAVTSSRGARLKSASSTTALLSCDGSNFPSDERVADATVSRQQNVEEEPAAVPTPRVTAACGRG